MSNGRRNTVDDVPKFGVPKQIGWRDVPFLAAVGLPLTMLLWGVLAMVLESIGREVSSEDPLAAVGILVTTGLGPALAYYLQLGLRAAHVSRAIGCLGLVAWMGLVLVGASAGPLVALLVGTISLLAGLALLARSIDRERRSGR